MIATSTVKLIILVLLALTIIWLLRIIFRKEYESLFRVIIVCLILGGALYLVQQSKSEKFSISEIKRSFFPVKVQPVTYEIQNGVSDGANFTRYIFKEPCPKISLTLDSTGKFFHITDVSSVNAVLESLKLPKVSTKAQELASITGKKSDSNMYRWEDYSLGILILERGLCTKRESLESYICITSIIIKQRF
jgi:hypothetical protein